MVHIQLFLLIILPCTCFSEYLKIERSEVNKKAIVFKIDSVGEMIIPQGSQIEYIPVSDSVSRALMLNLTYRITVSDTTTIRFYKSTEDTYHLPKGSTILGYISISYASPSGKKILTGRWAPYHKLTVILGGDFEYPRYGMILHKGSTFELSADGDWDYSNSIHIVGSGIIMGLPVDERTKCPDEILTTGDTLFQGNSIPSNSLCYFDRTDNEELQLSQVTLGGRAVINDIRLAKSSILNWEQDTLEDHSAYIKKRRVPRYSEIWFDTSGNVLSYNKIRRVILLPSFAVGIGTGFSGTGVGFHLDSKIGLFLLPKSRGPMLNPSVGYQLNIRDSMYEHLFSVGSYFVVDLGGGYVRFALLPGGDLLISPNSDNKLGFKVGAKILFGRVIGVELAFQNCNTNEFQLTFTYDIGTLALW